LLDGAWTANVSQNGLVVRKLAQVLPTLRGVRVAIFGLTYKPETSTLRRSASIDVIADLNKAGAVINAHDPRADRTELAAHAGFAFFEDPMAAVAAAEALVLMTPWQQYRDVDFRSVKQRMARPYVLDTAGFWDAQQLMELGFTYDDIGRGRHPVA
jgi:UDPglucose 6-dehydrogenase